MLKFKLPKKFKRTSGLTVLENGRLHAVRYIWEEGLQIKQLVDKGIYRGKSGIAIEETPKDYLKNFLRGDSTGKKMVWWDDNFIDQNLSYENAAKIIKLMDSIFKTIMKEEGFQSRTIHNDRSLGTEMYENDNYEELIDCIKHTWDKAYRIAYESITKNELPNELIHQEFSPRYMQPERMIDPIVNYLADNDKCTMEVPGGSGKSKCAFRISQLICEALGLPWKVLGVGNNISVTVQLCNEYSKFYKGQTGQRLLDLYIIGSINANDYRLLESWANVYSVSNDKLSLYLKQAYDSPNNCAFFVVNKSANDFLALADKIKVNFKKFFTILDEIQDYSRETGIPKMVTNSQCAIINPKYGHLIGLQLGLSATHIPRPEHITDVRAVYNDDLDKFGPCIARVTEIEARSFGWICDKQGVVIPIPTDDIFADAIAENAIFNIEMFGVNKPFNPVTYVGVEGIRLLSHNNKILVLVSRRVDIEMIASVLRLYQDNGQLDNNFNIIEGYAECNNACINNFNKSSRAIMIATRWIGVGNDTYTCDCTLPLYNPESRAFIRQFGMRSDRVYQDKVSTFALVASESRLEDSPWFESLQMISNGEQLNIVSQAQFRQERESVIGGTRNVTLIRPERTERPEIALQWEEIMRLVSTKAYIDEATGKTRFSEIVGINETNYNYEMIRNFVQDKDYLSLARWADCLDGLRYYAYAYKQGWHLSICDELGLKYSKEFNEEMFNEFMIKYNPTTKQEFDMYAKQENCVSLRKIAVREGWFDNNSVQNAKVGWKNKATVTLPMLKKWIKDNNLEGTGAGTARQLPLTDDKSGFGYSSQRMMSAYNKFVKLGKLEPILTNPKGRDTGKKINVIDKEGNIVNTFNKLKDAGDALDINPTSISNVLRNDTKTAGGYRFEYAKN